MLQEIKFDDMPNIAQLKAMFLDLSSTLEHDGKTWKYKLRSPHREVAIRFDKFMHEKSKDFILSLKPKNSVLTGKSIRELLEPHLQQKFLLQCDISQYFENVRYRPIIEKSLAKGSFDDETLERVEKFYFDNDKGLRRGLRASAMLSEIMGIAIDSAVKKLINTLELRDVTFTRYYDDILLSGNDRQALRSLETALSDTLLELGLTINGKKSRLTPIENSRVLGLRVHKRQIIVPKKFKRIARARAHQFDAQYMAMNSYDWEDHSQLQERRKQVGSVIGSYWHIVNNSQTNTAFEKNQIEHYTEILRELTNALHELYDDESIFYED